METIMVPPLTPKKVKGRGIKAGHGAVGILFFVLVVGLAAMGETEGAAADGYHHGSAADTGNDICNSDYHTFYKTFNH